MQKPGNIQDMTENLMTLDDSISAEPERGIVSYRCKVYRALLDIHAASNYKERPLVVRSGRGLINRPS